MVILGIGSVDDGFGGLVKPRLAQRGGGGALGVRVVGVGELDAAHILNGGLLALGLLTLWARKVRGALRGLVDGGGRRLAGGGELVQERAGPLAGQHRGAFVAAHLGQVVDGAVCLVESELAACEESPELANGAKRIGDCLARAVGRGAASGHVGFDEDGADGGKVWRSVRSLS